MAGGKTEILFSGEVTSNSYVDKKFSTLGFGKTTINIEVVDITSGATLSYRIRGYPAVEGTGKAPGYSIPLKTDLTLGSGYIAQYTVTDAYDQMSVGVKNTTTNKSGRVTVTISRKRRQ